MTDLTIPQAPFKFTQARLEALPFTEAAYRVKDTEQPGLLCWVYPPGKKYPDGLKVLQIYKKPKGGTAPVRVNVCRLGELPLTGLKGQPSARSAVDGILAMLRQGVNPNEAERQRQAEERAEKKADELAGITLSDAFSEFCKVKPLRPRTLAGYTLAIERDLKAWHDRPLREITGAEAVTLHAELARESKHTAARAMQVLRAVHKFATDFYGTDGNELPFGRCPVDKVNRVAPKWSKSAARTDKLRVEDLKPWLAAVRRIAQEQPRGDGTRMALYLELVLLTALRRREAAGLRWADVDLRRGTLTVRETKNHTDHTLPITARVREILEARKATREEGDECVFGSAEVRWQLLRIEKTTGINVGPHGLRRSWASFADRAGLGAYAIKAALNHSTTGDVTGTHYAQIDTEDLRPLMQRVEDFILRQAKQTTGKVIKLRAGGAK
ncbi:MAG: site-specific integrase [Chromatiaceae bacterium]|nr:site-specific integrase [Chromatiaceae bacterium]